MAIMMMLHQVCGAAEACLFSFSAFTHMADIRVAAGLIFKLS
jgi:hypothetical protein